MGDYFAHSSAFVDDGCEIGEGTKIWHFGHVMPGARLGRDCILGQNVHIASGVDPALTKGQEVRSQYWFRDPPSASTTGLSDGLLFTIHH